MLVVLSEFWTMLIFEFSAPSCSVGTSSLCWDWPHAWYMQAMLVLRVDWEDAYTGIRYEVHRYIDFRVCKVDLHLVYRGFSMLLALQNWAVIGYGWLCRGDARVQRYTYALRCTWLRGICFVLPLVACSRRAAELVYFFSMLNSFYYQHHSRTALPWASITIVYKVQHCFFFTTKTTCVQQ